MILQSVNNKNQNICSKKSEGRSGNRRYLLSMVEDIDYHLSGFSTVEYGVKHILCLFHYKGSTFI